MCSDFRFAISFPPLQKAPNSFNHTSEHKTLPPSNPPPPHHKILLPKPNSPGPPFPSTNHSYLPLTPSLSRKMCITHFVKKSHSVNHTYALSNQAPFSARRFTLDHIKSHIHCPSLSQREKPSIRVPIC